jgi:hypothetical protein
MRDLHGSFTIGFRNMRCALKAVINPVSRAIAASFRQSRKKSVAEKGGGFAKKEMQLVVV